MSEQQSTSAAAIRGGPAVVRSGPGRLPRSLWPEPSFAAGAETRRASATLLILTAAGVAVMAALAGPVRAEVPDFTPDQMGGTLRRCISAEPQSLNPITGKDLYERYVNEYIFEYLLERNLDTGELEGVLAKDWEVSDDGTVIVFHLKPEARFSDGHPVTSEDVVFSFDTVRNPEIDARSMASYLSKCESCVAVDEHTVRFVWKERYFKSLESSGNLFPIIPKHIYASNVEVDPKEAEERGITHFNDLVQGFVGSGPYLFDRWTTGSEIHLVRNEAYWGKPRAFDRIIFRIINEEQASVQAFHGGELDDLAIAPEWWDKLKDDDRRGRTFEIYRYNSPANGYTFIAWNHAQYETLETVGGGTRRIERPHPIFSDWRVRRAITHLIDRRTLMKHVYYNVGQVATGPFWPQSPQADQGVQPWPYDRAEAMRLLAEAGWKDRDNDGWLENPEGQRFAFEWTMPSGNQQTLDLSRIVTEEFRRAGIDVQARFIDWPVFITRLDNRDFDAVMLAWGGGGVESDPYQIWHSDAIADQGHNFISFRSDEADRLIEQARAELDAERRNRLFHEFHRLLHRLQPYTFFWARESLRMVSTRVRGAQVHYLGMDTEAWWIPAESRLDAQCAAP